MNDNWREFHFYAPMRLPTKTHHDKKLSVTKKGRPTMYDSQELKDIKQKLLSHFSKHVPSRPLESPVEIHISYLYEADDKHPAGTYKTTKPDLDNLTKLVQDTLAKLKFIGNDSGVAILYLKKFYVDGTEGVAVQARELRQEVRKK